MASSSGSGLVLPASFLPTGGKKVAYHCSACKRDTTLQLRIKCAECSNFELCGDCFSSGVTRHPHKSTHDYRVVDCLDVPLFTKDWTANEELLLLEGIDKCGAGNWKTIAEYMGTGKTTRQVEEHYWEGYMGRHGYCLPVTTFTVPDIDETAPTETLVPAEGPVGADGYPMDPKDCYRIPVVPGYVRGEEVVRDFRSVAGGPALAPAGGRGGRGGGNAADAPAAKTGTDLPGYMVLREDFDFEHENDAENLLADMEFGPDDHPSERELKLQVIRIYNSKLDDRERRKRFVIDRGLVDRKEQIAQDRRRSKEERDVVARLRVFARFHSAADHEALVRLAPPPTETRTHTLTHSHSHTHSLSLPLTHTYTHAHTHTSSTHPTPCFHPQVDGVLRARKLRQQIAIYQLYRKLGIRTLEQARVYEAERKRRENEIKSRKQRSEALYLYETGRTSNGTARGAAASSSSSSSAAGGAGRGRGRRVRDEEEEEDGGEPAAKSGRGGRGRDDACDVDPDAPTAADVARAPGAQLLSEKELALCKAVPMLPMHYLAAKVHYLACSPPGRHPPPLSPPPTTSNAHFLQRHLRRLTAHRTPWCGRRTATERSRPTGCIACSNWTRQKTPKWRIFSCARWRWRCRSCRA